MAIYEVEDPNTGTVLELEGDAPPSEAELEEIFSSYSSPPRSEPEVPKGFAASAFPSTSKAISEGGALAAPKAALGAFTDVMSIPQRGVAALAGYDFSDPNAYIGREAARTRVDGSAPKREELFKPVQGQPAQTGMNMMLGGAIDQPEEFARPIREFATQAATDPLSFAGAIPKGVSALGKAGTNIRQGSEKLSQELTGVSREALKMGSTKGGRQALQEASGRQAEIGNQITEALEDFHSYLPEREIVEQSLKKMPPVDISGTIKALQDAKIKPASNGAILAHERRANQEIDQLIADLRGSKKPGQMPKTKLTAQEAYDIRRRLDYATDFNVPEFKIVNAARIKARTQLKNDLLRAAGQSGNPEYAKAMKDWSRKLGLKEKIESRLGLTKNTREARSEAFVKNLFGKNSAQKQALVRDLDEVFGSDFLDQSRVTFLADEIGDGGKAAWLPRQSTGRSTLAVGGGALASSMGLGPIGGGLVGGTLAAHASPAVASRVVLPTVGVVERFLNNGVFKSAQSKAAAKAFLRTTNAATQAKLYKIMQNELEGTGEE